MPSRKKAQGQARKAEKEKKQAAQAAAQRRASCNHFARPENATQDDLIEAQSLLSEYIVKKLNLIVFNDFELLDALIDETYDKYFDFDDVRKQVFREAILAEGTAQCVKESNEIDLTKMQVRMRAWDFVQLLAYTEVWDKNQGTSDAHSRIELVKQLHATVRCPREVVRFFHRRNSCDCLHEVYYKLKDTTKRTTFCCNCPKAVDIKTAFHCKCELYKYCSKKCALGDWPRHKERCRHARESN
jgi:hypothetical protein